MVMVTLPCLAFGLAAALVLHLFRVLNMLQRCAWPSCAVHSLGAVVGATAAFATVQRGAWPLRAGCSTAVTVTTRRPSSAT